MKFSQLKTTQKGELGESIIREYLEAKGWIVYNPVTENKAHYFDILATKNKQKVLAIDVKTKARLNNWNAQGIDLKHFKQYLKFTNDTNIPFWLFFVDDKTGDVHCSDITKLTNGFSPCKEIIAWELKQMNHLFKITDEQIKELSKFDTRKHEFKPNN
jgi:Holliday junction resolvase